MDAICRASLPAYRLRATSDRTGNYGYCYNCPPGSAIPVHTRYRYMTRSMRALAAFRIIGRRRVRWRWRLTREAELHARFVESWHVADEEADKRRPIRGR